MPKRVHKPEGSSAWKKAMEKTLKRMAKDSVKAQSNSSLPKAMQKQKEMMNSFIKNKSRAQSHFILEKWDAAFRNARKEERHAINQMAVFGEQRKALANGVKNNLRTYLGKHPENRDRKFLLKAKTGLELYIQKLDEHIAKMEAITNPYIQKIKKEELRKLKAEKKKLERQLEEIEKRTKEAD